MSLLRVTNRSRYSTDTVGCGFFEHLLLPSRLHTVCDCNPRYENALERNSHLRLYCYGLTAFG